MDYVLDISVVAGPDEKSRISTELSPALAWNLTWLLDAISGTDSVSWLTWRRNLTTL
jgi:hypothetical protein